MTFLAWSSGQGVRISANNRALDPDCLLTRQMRKKAQCDWKKQRRIEKTSFTFLWQSVNRRVYQQISNKDVDIRGEALHFMQQQSEIRRRNLWSFVTHLDTWNKITPSSLLLKLLYNLPHQHNFSTSMGQNLSPTFSVPPWLYSAKSNRIHCFLYFCVSSGYKSRRLTWVLWCERWHNYRYVTRKSGDWGYQSPNVKLVKQVICHSQSAN